MKQEYKDLALYLGQNFPNKKFIIANWEADNDIYCGTAYGFNIKTQCDYKRRMAGIKQWFAVRHQGIREANQKNVFSGIEFNIVNFLKESNLPSVLYDVIPDTLSDYYLYSAYESTNRLYDTDEASAVGIIKSDISKIKEILSASEKTNLNLIIGEYGFGSSDSLKNKQFLAKAMEVFLNAKYIKYIIIWNLLNSGGNFGLVNEMKQITPSGKYICEILKGPCQF
jgi:hypothetical protein